MQIIMTKTRRYLYWEKQLNLCRDSISGAKALRGKEECLKQIYCGKQICARLNYMDKQRQARIARRCRFKQFKGVPAAPEKERFPIEIARPGQIAHLQWSLKPSGDREIIYPEEVRGIIQKNLSLDSFERKGNANKRSW